MELNEYQKKTTETARFDNEAISPIAYTTLGLVGEAGEVAEKIKKVFRDDKGVISDEKRQEIKKEIGDVLWYTAQLARLLDISLDDVARTNLKKLQSRLKREVIHGSGDNR